MDEEGWLQEKWYKAVECVGRGGVFWSANGAYKTEKEIVKQGREQNYKKRNYSEIEMKQKREGRRAIFLKLTYIEAVERDGLRELPALHVWQRREGVMAGQAKKGS